MRGASTGDRLVFQAMDVVARSPGLRLPVRRLVLPYRLIVGVPRMLRPLYLKPRRPGLLPLLAAIGLTVAIGGYATGDDPLPNTKLLSAEGDLAAQMVAGIDQFLLRETAALLNNHSGQPSRERLTHIIGATDDRVEFKDLELVGTLTNPPRVAQAEGYEVVAVRWPVLRGRGGDTVYGEGLLVQPKVMPPLANVVAIPDADSTPEMLLGLTPGIQPSAQFARRLAENGCRVLVPTLIDRDDSFSIVGGSRKTNQPHREFIYRMSYELGRHIIGYEVDKIRSAVDWFERDAALSDKQIGVFGYGEGGLLAFHAAALDPRIDVACVSGYFDNRSELWQEPIYRNVFGVLPNFADAELATLIAPRSLIVEAAQFPEVDAPPPVRDGRSGAAPGRLKTPDLETVKNELNRGKSMLPDETASRFTLVASDNGRGSPGCDKALTAFLKTLCGDESLQLTPSGSSPQVLRSDFGEDARRKRQFDEMVAYTQGLMLESEYVRRDYWAEADPQSVGTWKASTESYRQAFYNEVIGNFARERLPLNPRTRQIYDTPKFVGYEVMHDVFDDVFAYGILLVPQDIKPGEQRPVVVCQHGLEGRPSDVADPEHEHPAYHRYACQLAERGFITYAPQNPYLGQDAFRTLQRKANPLGKTLFSIIIPQHQATVEWLTSLPAVDPQRIAFYGLSYGGKSAMRIPAVVEEYCLSICSADFNEWIWKNSSARAPYSYLGTGEYEMFEFNLGRTYNYAEMAGLIAPRPFMVERGHDDGVAPDEWVAYEYAKVRRLFAKLGIPERTTIEFFNGPHMINGVGTFAFLHKHLDWSQP